MVFATTRTRVLVVAADKARPRSRTLHAISLEYASGSATLCFRRFAGYDHKKMAITARAWECVKRIPRDRVDIQSQNFTVCGIGDMAGDVFGNGMLQSPCIRLVAAFNHQHIFIDPQPDPKRSFAERERMSRCPLLLDDYSPVDFQGRRIYRGPRKI